MELQYTRSCLTTLFQASLNWLHLTYTLAFIYSFPFQLPHWSSLLLFLRNWEVGPVQSQWELLSPSCQKTVNQWLVTSQHNQAKLIWHADTYYVNVLTHIQKHSIFARMPLHCMVSIKLSWYLWFIYKITYLSIHHTVKYTNENWFCTTEIELQTV